MLDQSAISNVSALLLFRRLRKPPLRTGKSPSISRTEHVTTVIQSRFNDVLQKKNARQVHTVLAKSLYILGL